MKTMILNPKHQTRKWWVIDAREAVLGRLASTAAGLLMGKHKKNYDTAHDQGDFVIIINAEHIVFTGTKREDMRYFNHSQYAGGWRNLTVTQVQSSRPGFPVRHAIMGMIPRNPRGYKIATKLHIYNGPVHPHVAQNPELYPLRTLSPKAK